MKKAVKRILITIVMILCIGFIGYQGIYSRVYNQSNTKRDTGIGADVEQLSAEKIIRDMAGFSNRYAGSKDNSSAVQYIRNYFNGIGLEPFYDESYYQSFESDYLKCSRYFMVNVHGTIENVIGKIKGKNSTKAVVISAHMDSFLSKGVLDNASGTAVLLKTAQKLSQEFQPEEYPIDIIFAAYNAEESGLIGSSAFYQELSNEYRDFYNINLDCVGARDKPLAVKNEHETSSELYREFIPFLDQYEIPYKNVMYAANSDGEVTGTSDHEIFQEHGHAAIILGEDDIIGIVHSKQDNSMENLDFDEIDRLISAVVEFIKASDGKDFSPQ